MLATITAALLGAGLFAKPKHKHHPAPPRDISVAAERLERRRVVRLVIIAALTRREAEIEDFLVATATEMPLLSSRASVVVGPVEIGPATVGLDFLGNPIIRATVRNRSSAPVSALLIAHLAYGGARVAEASIAVPNLAPGERRAVDMLCPSAIRPTALRWTLEPW